MTTQIKTFCFTSTVFFGVIAAVACVYLVLTGGEDFNYTAYLVVLFAGGFGGGVISTLYYRRVMHQEIARMEYQAAQLTELNRELGTLHDVADRREEFIASFAHELKTPLTAIIGYADMLRSRELTPKTRFTAAGYIFSEGKRLEALSLKLMDIIVAGKQTFERKPLDVGYFIRSVATVTVPSLSNDQIRLETRYEPGIIHVEPDLFKTLVINLVDNARKASRAHSTIELFGEVETDGYALYVRDHGRGMKQEELGKITEPFYMIDKSRSRAQNGAGLGLALCQRIAELHGTTLEYTSELGKGTTVRILLTDGDKGDSRKKAGRKAGESPAGSARGAGDSPDVSDQAGTGAGLEAGRGATGED